MKPTENEMKMKMMVQFSKNDILEKEPLKMDRW